jgi:rhomboid protease GluP
MTDLPAPSTPVDRPRERLLAALLTVAERKGVRIVPDPLPDLHWLTLLTLPEQGAGVALLDCDDLDPEALRTRLDRLLAAHAQGLMFLVLVGGAARERATLQAADRQAPDPNRLGVYHLDGEGRLERVAGRRSGLLAEAGRHLRNSSPLTPEGLAAIGERVQREQEEAAHFAAALEKRPQHATRILGAVCILTYILSQHWARQDGFGETLVRMGANSAPLVQAGEIWRLLSHAFLHGSFVHLAINLVALLSFGGFLEGMLGWRRYLLLYGLSALAGGIASSLIAGVFLSVGASGAIWGLMGAGIGLVSVKSGFIPRAIGARLRPRLLGVLLLNTAFSILPLFMAGMGKIDLYAHAGGGLVGFALAASGLLTRGLRAPGSAEVDRELAALRIAAAAMVVLLAASIGLALFTGRPWVPLEAI